MAVKRDDAARAKVLRPSDAGKTHARRMEEFRARAEKISRELAGRRHSDSAALVAEDRAR
jgi:hypothetical protein